MFNFEISFEPIFAPNMVPAEIKRTNVNLILFGFIKKCDIVAVMAEKIIVDNEIGIVFRISVFNKIVKAGIIIAPPPIPIEALAKPEKNPTTIIEIFVVIDFLEVLIVCNSHI